MIEPYYLPNNLRFSVSTYYPIKLQAREYQCKGSSSNHTQQSKAADMDVCAIFSENILPTKGDDLELRRSLS
jgi:hypothetical protein